MAEPHKDPRAGCSFNEYTAASPLVSPHSLDLRIYLCVEGVCCTEEAVWSGSTAEVEQLCLSTTSLKTGSCCDEDEHEESLQWRVY